MKLSTYFEDTDKMLSDLKRKPEQYWIKRGEKMALKLFHQMSDRVPAYKDFLKKNKIDPFKIKTISEFRQVPTIDKKNYLREYPREQLCWDGNFENNHWVISATSGSTGEPYYFPRTELQDKYYEITADIYLRTNFSIDKKSTLYIIGFPMGIWIGGLFTYQALRSLSNRNNYNLSIITPGINKLEIIRAVQNLGMNFDQIIIGSYAPFLKDIIDDGIAMGLDWKKYNLGFIFSAEGFSETFRDYIFKKTGLKNIYTDTLNHYGTVDLGTMAHETPLSILIRRNSLTDIKIYKSLFQESIKLPTLTQYIPEMFYFETIDNNIICSSYSGLPLVRYDLKDHGGILTYEEIKNIFRSYGNDLVEEIEKAKMAYSIWNIPFVYIYERSDFSVSFFAFQIYPETIRHALQEKLLEEKVTGKFTMQVTYDKNSEQVFEIHVECKRDVKASARLIQSIQKIVIERLKKENSEFRKTSEEYPDRVIPKVTLWPYEHPKYFRVGIKQKWVKNN